MLSPVPGTATIQDVARRAEVSVSTVSNVLNGREARMRPETLERVRRAIAELAFRPNPSARHLKTGRLQMIGLLVPSIANPFYGTLARWVEAAALERGFGVLLCNTQRDAMREREYAEALMAQGVRGVIMGSALQAQEHLGPMVARGLAVVCFDRTAQSLQSPAPLMDYVSMDNARAAAMAVAHLVALGHQHIAYVSAEAQSMNRVARLQGATQACAEAGVTLHTHVSPRGAGYAEGELAELGRAAALDLCRQASPCTGWIAMNDMVAIGVLAGLRDSGRRVPEDVSLVGIDDQFLGQYLSPSLTTVRQPMQAIAQAAVERVLARMQSSGESPHEQVFLPELVVRESSGARA